MRTPSPRAPPHDLTYVFVPEHRHHLLPPPRHALLTEQKVHPRVVDANTPPSRRHVVKNLNGRSLERLCRVFALVTPPFQSLVVLLKRFAEHHLLIIQEVIDVKLALDWWWWLVAARPRCCEPLRRRGTPPSPSSLMPLHLRRSGRGSFVSLHAILRCALDLTSGAEADRANRVLLRCRRGRERRRCCGGALLRSGL